MKAPAPAGDVTGLRISTLAMILSAALLGQALQRSNGNLDPFSLIALAGACVFAALANFPPHWGWLEKFNDGPAVALAGVALAWQFIQLFTSPPAMYLRVSAADYMWFLTLLAAVCFLAGTQLAHSPWLGRWGMPLILLLHFMLGVWLIQGSPRPVIDVFLFHKDGIAALTHGNNPYAITFPDIYGRSPFYGPDVYLNGRLNFGYPYPPITLLMTVPAELLAGDYRYAQLTALTLTGAIMAYARPSRLSRAAALLFLFTPRFLFVLEQGWVEPLIVFLFALAAAASIRGFPALVPCFVGLFVASKQYVPFGLPALLLWFGRPIDWRAVQRFAVRAAVIAVAIVLPFALWNTEAFARSVITLQLKQPFRRDSLSFITWLFQNAPQLPAGVQWLPTALALGAGVLCLRFGRRNVFGVCLASAFVFLLFFATSKQSFCNSYLLPLGISCLAVAVARDEFQRSG